MNEIILPNNKNGLEFKELNKLINDNQNEINEMIEEIEEYRRKLELLSDFIYKLHGPEVLNRILD